MPQKALPHTVALADLLTSHGFTRHPMLRNKVGHLQLPGTLAGRAIDLIVDTGAAKTVVDLAYCQAQGLALRDTGLKGGGAGGSTMPIYALGDTPLTIDGAKIAAKGIFAIDMSHVNHGLTSRGAPAVHAVLGADILLQHHAVIDYSTISLFLQHEKDPQP
jgi:hypothetical protein